MINLYFIVAENIAKKWTLSRGEQDEFALNSQLKCEAARGAGHFSKEIVAVHVKERKGQKPEGHRFRAFYTEQTFSRPRFE